MDAVGPAERSDASGRQVIRGLRDGAVFFGNVVDDQTPAGRNSPGWVTEDLKYGIGPGPVPAHRVGDESPNAIALCAGKRRIISSSSDSRGT
jgi:hypothetical protein